MGQCIIAPSVQENRFARDISTQLAKQGVSCREMDAGYSVVNYSGNECPKAGDASCVRGRGDGVVEADEILEYAFNRYGKYQALLQRVLPRTIPWVLDDLDPSTTFDAELRKKLGDVIGKLKGILKDNRLKTGSEAYQEKLALGLLYLASAARSSSNESAIFTEELAARLDAGKLRKFREYVDSIGGLRVRMDYSAEQSAIDAIRTGKGKCTENANILHAIMSMAGLSPQFVFVGRMDPKVLRYAAPASEGEDHVCVGLRIRGKLRLFDSSYAIQDPRHADVFPLTPRQFYAFTLVNQGAMVSRKKDVMQAFADASNAIAIDARCAKAYYNRGNILRERRELDAAMADYGRAQRIQPHNGLISNQQGLVWEDRGQHRKAIDSFTHVIRLMPKSTMGYLNRGRAWGLAGEYEKAIEDFTQVLALDPTVVDAYKGRGLAWSLRGDREKALADLTRALDIDPDDAVAYWFRGGCLLGKGDVDKAIEDYTAAIARNPRWENAYVSRCRAWNKKGMPDKAIADCNKAIELNPRGDDAYMNRGMAWLAMKQPDKAIADFSKAISLAPKSAKAYAGRAKAWTMKGDAVKARADQEKVRALEKAK